MASEHNHGVDIIAGEGGARINLGCIHQSGRVYVVPAEKSWVCSPEMMPGHALAGFLGELTEEPDPKVEALMQRWGVYFRSLPLDDAED